MGFAILVSNIDQTKLSTVNILPRYLKRFAAERTNDTKQKNLKSNGM